MYIYKMQTPSLNYDINFKLGKQFTKKIYRLKLKAFIQKKIIV